MIRHFDKIKNKLLAGPKEQFPSNKCVVAFACINKHVWVGNNSKKSHPQMQKHYRNGMENSCHHAEFSALAKVPRQSRHKAEIYVVRFLRNGDVTMAKPCLKCQQYLLDNGVNFKNVYYTDWIWAGKWSRLSDDKRQTKTKKK